MTAGVGVLATPPAHSAVFPAPGPGHNITVLTTQDAITMIEDSNVAVTVNVLRNGVVIGTAAGTTDTGGVLQVNHPGGICFTGHTPVMVPGDVVQVTTPTVTEQTTAANVTATTQVNNAGVIQVHGVAADAAGAPLPIGQVDVRLVSKSIFAVNGRRDIRAGGGGLANGTFAYDAPGSTAFTASFPNLSTGDQALALGSLARTDWLGVVPAAVNEITVYDVGFVPAPIPACVGVAPASSFGVTAADRPAINAANAATPLTLSGTATDATATTVTLTDTAGTAVSAVAALTPAAGAQTWTATVTPAQVATLADGPLTAAGSYTTAAGVVTGSTLTVLKKVALPAAPTMTPAAGLYTKTQIVTLSDTDPTAAVHFTTDGTVPSATSPTFAAPFSAPMGTTTVRAIAIDVAGNASPETGGTIQVTPPPATAGAALSPTSLSMGSVESGTHSSPGYLVLKNTGTAPLSVTASVSGPDADEFSVNLGKCGLLAVGATCNPSISFNPLRAGAAQAQVVLATSAGNRMVAVSGTATAPPTGYWMLGGDGNVFNFGDASFDGGLGGIPLSAPVVAMAATPTNQGYWVTTADGLVFAFGDATTHGSMAGQALSAPIVGIAATPSGNGYWLLGRDGGIFSFGDAQFFGSTGGMKLNQPILGLAATPTGGGYWLVASDGGIFAYGDAGFFGSTGSIKLNKPIVGMQPTASGQGYWLVASDGGIFAYGDAGFFGSTGSIKLNKPIVAMAATTSGQGYWLIASDGGIFAYGDAPFLGSAAATGDKHIIGGVSLHL